MKEKALENQGGHCCLAENCDALPSSQEALLGIAWQPGLFLGAYWKLVHDTCLKNVKANGLIGRRERGREGGKERGLPWKQ